MPVRPRACGRQDRRRWGLVVLRFTPTCVGTALSSSPLAASSSVHPHVRGDGSETVPKPRAVFGSPPRAWGRQLQHLAEQDAVRFTPTCVGTARPRCRSSPMPTVHPHVRGDGEWLKGDPHSEVGSPPRAWGRLGHAAGARRCRRFTPTCVGTARPRCRSSPMPTVHPHVRGDGLLGRPRLCAFCGSPPRAWGRRHCR